MLPLGRKWYRSFSHEARVIMKLNEREITELAALVIAWVNVLQLQGLACEPSLPVDVVSDMV